MNLNIPLNEYQLNASLADEVIRVYGVPLKLILSEKINEDSVFGDFSHLKVDNTSIFEIYGFPDNADEYEAGEALSSNFGFMGETNVDIYISKFSFDKLFADKKKGEIQLDKIVNSLIILPSQKVLEITDLKVETPSINNLFMFNNLKNCYRLKCRSYHFKEQDELSSDMFNSNSTDNDYLDTNELKTLESYFDELTNIKEEQDLETKEYMENPDPVFGRF